MRPRFAAVIAVMSAMSALLPTAGCLANDRPKGKAEPHPIVNRHSFLVGGTVNGKWLGPKAMSRYLRGGEHYRLYSEKSFRGTAVGSRPDDYFVKMNPGMGEPIAIAGGWNALPRTVRHVQTSQDAYIAAVRAAVRQQGLVGKTTVSIKQLIQVDLEGDGANEVLICAHSDDWDYISYKPGQYSVVLLRRLVNGRARTDVVSIGMYTTTDIPLFYSIDGVWDLDGDGKMEIVVSYVAAPYESYGTMIYALKQSKPVLLASLRPNPDPKVHANGEK